MTTRQRSKQPNTRKTIKLHQVNALTAAVLTALYGARAMAGDPGAAMLPAARSPGLLSRRVSIPRRNLDCLSRTSHLTSRPEP